MALLALFLAALAAQPAEPARGANGAVLGSAAESAMPGPSRICFYRTAVDIAPGETAYLEYLGIHSASIRVVGRDAFHVVAEGDAWRNPRGGRRVRDRRGRSIVFHDRPDGPFYLIYSRGRGTRHGRPFVRVSGSAVTGTARDRAFLDRIDVEIPDHASCGRRFAYGLFFEDGE